MERQPAVRIRFLGGAGAIGASCALAEIGGARLLVDCGVRLQGSLQERLPDLADLEEGPPPDAVLVTHAHLDHIGALPVLLQRFPALTLYATPPTIALMRIQLLDALKIMEADSEAEGEVPLYSRPAVETLLSRTLPVKPYAPFEVTPGGPRATFFLSGHILGACSVGLEAPEGRVLFTGDVSTANQRTIPGMSVPRFRPHLVVSESTYGARLHASRPAEEERLVRMIGETIAGRGKVLIPAFAIGRAQEVILTLIQAMLTHRLSPFPVHVDGLVRNVCQVYREFPAYLQPRLKRRVERFGDPFFDVLENVRPVAGQKRRQEILEGPPCAIVASSGMLTGGASPVYARALLDGPEHLIAITGYQDEESPGRRLLDAAEGRLKAITVGGRELPVRCRVEKYALSAHADGNGLAGLIRALRPSDTLLVHGGPEARQELADLLLRERLGRVHLPLEGNSYGFVLGSGAEAGGSRVLQSGLGGGALETAALRKHLLSVYRPGASFTPPELYRIWHGRDPGAAESESFEAEIRAFAGFEEDPHRPFHFSAAPEEAFPAGPLEQNQLLARIDAALPREASLLRKSIPPGEQSVELHFAFPDRALPRWREQIESAFEGTGWTWSVHDTPNAAALNRLIDERIPRRELLARAPSVRMPEREVTLWLARDLSPEEEADWDRAAKDVEDESGFRLSREVHRGTPGAGQARDRNGRLEINLTYQRIREAFQDTPHRPARVGLHPGPDKITPVIRVAFISPEVGERYREVLEGLERETGWGLKVAPGADQNAICEEARKLVSPLGRIRRGPKFLARERAVSLELEAAPLAVDDLRKEFRERTGYDLSVAFKAGRPERAGGV